MTVEELFSFGKSRHLYINHKFKDYYKTLKNRFVAKNSITTYCNFFIPDPEPAQIKLPYYTSVYPQHKAKLQPEHLEGILCTDCEDIIPIYRHVPRISKDLSLSNRFSTYHPQSSKSCRCDNLSVLVSHKGIPHIYTDSTFELITYFNNHELRHHDFSYSELPRPLNAILERTPQSRWEPTCSIALKDFNRISEIGMVIPITQVYSKSLINTFIEHLRRYAYTFSILIYTRGFIYLPNGIILNTAYPEVREWLAREVPADQVMPKYSIKRIQGAMFSCLANHNEYAESFNKYICEIYSLPYVPLKYYPKNTITYMQFIKPEPLVYHQDVPYTTFYYHTRLKQLRRMVARIARKVLLSDNIHDVAMFTKDNYPAKPLAVPPVSAYITTAKLNPKRNALLKELVED